MTLLLRRPFPGRAKPDPGARNAGHELNEDDVPLRGSFVALGPGSPSTSLRSVAVVREREAGVGRVLPPLRGGPGWGIREAKGREATPRARRPSAARGRTALARRTPP